MTASRRALYQRVGSVVDTRRLRAAFSCWKLRLKAKRQTEWRDGMRMKMKIIREKKEAKLRKDAWAKWRQSYRSHLSAQHYAERLVLRFLHRWRERLAKVDHMEAAADEFLYDTVGRRAEKCWDHWKVMMELRNSERVISERIDLRVMGNTLKIWRKHQ
jgi:protein SFI1